MIQPLIQQLTAQNPQLAQFLTEHPEALYQFLAGDDEDEDGDYEMGGGQGGPGGQEGTVIELTPSEAEAVRRVSPWFLNSFLLLWPA